MLLEAIAARTPCSGSGLKFTASSGGFSYSLPPFKAGPSGAQPPFSVIGIAADADAYLVTIREGWVIERQPKTGAHPAVRFHMPQYDGTSLNALPRPEIPMSINDTAWCRYRTDETGLIQYTPEIIVSSDDQPGSHYYPADPQGSGNAGDFYVRLFKLELDGSTPRVTVYQQSDIEHWAQLWTGQNTGTGFGVFKEHDEATNTYKFRSIAGDAVSLSEDGLTILVAGGTAGAHLDLFVTTVLYLTDSGTGFLYLTGSSYGYLYRWRHGHYVGKFAVNASPLAGDDQLTIDTEHVTHLLES